MPANEWHWRLLGLERGASKADIHKAYRRLSKLYHPDRGGSKEDLARLNDAVRLANEWPTPESTPPPHQDANPPPPSASPSNPSMQRVSIRKDFAGPILGTELGLAVLSGGLMIVVGALFFTLGAAGVAVGMAISIAALATVIYRDKQPRN
jgi:hypothetical protein